MTGRKRAIAKQIRKRFLVRVQAGAPFKARLLQQPDTMATLRLSRLLDDAHRASVYAPEYERIDTRTDAHTPLGPFSRDFGRHALNTGSGGI
jgi:hypothetical protein